MKKGLASLLALTAFGLMTGMFSAPALAEEDDIVFLYPEYNPLYAERWEGWDWDGLAEQVCTPRGVALDLGLSRDYDREAGDDDIIFLTPQYNPPDQLARSLTLREYFARHAERVGTGRDLVAWLTLRRVPAAVIDAYVRLLGGDLRMPVAFFAAPELLPEWACAATRGDLVFLANAAAKKGTTIFMLPDGTRITANAAATSGMLFAYADDTMRGAVFVEGPLACR